MKAWWEFLNRFFFRKNLLGESLFDDLDLGQFLDRTLTICKEKTKASNVIWIDAVEFIHLRHQIQTNSIEDPQELSKSYKIRALEDVSFDDLTKLLNAFDLDNDMMQIIGDQAILPINDRSGRQILGYWLILGLDPKSAPRAIQVLNGFASMICKHLGFCLQYHAARQESFLDDLTGLYNQRYLGLCVENEIHRCVRSSRKFSVLFMDIDYFKSVNDTHGHWVGSRLLVELAKVIQQDTRRSDYCFRYGGDEFVVVLSNSGQEGAVVAAERLRERVESTQFLVDGVEFKITMSIGIATYPDHAQSHKDIIHMADQAMYCGKNKSRNIVYMAS